MVTHDRQLKVKICGNTSAEDLALAGEAGADFGGVILDVPQSPRSAPLDRAAELARDAPLPLVAVLLDAPLASALRAAEALRPAAIQLHGRESEDFVASLRAQVECEVWKVLHLPPAQEGSFDAEVVLGSLRRYAEAGCDAVLLDTATEASGRGGTGLTSDWERARSVVSAAELPVILAGGLNPANVSQAVATVQPAGVDAASGLEHSPGRKDAVAVREFVRLARAASARPALE